MVAKLLKHELSRIARTAAIPVIAMIALAVLFRISLINYSGDMALPIIIGVFYVIAIVVTLIVCAWVGIVRFYRTLFTPEGYMTLSLPVTADQLIISKLVSSLIAVVCGAIVCVLSALILLIGQPLSITVLVEEVLSEIAYFFSFTSQAAGPLYTFEVVLLIIFSIPEAFLLFYLAMSVGQLFTTKNRTVITLVLYFVVAFVWSIIYNSVGIVVLEAASKVSVHLAIWIQIILTLAVDVGSYFIIRYIIKNKVNLLT